MKKFYVVLSDTQNYGGSMTPLAPMCSKKFPTLEKAKEHASKLKSRNRTTQYDYIIAVAVEVMEVPIPKCDWKKVE